MYLTDTGSIQNIYLKHNGSTRYAYRIERCMICIEFIMKQNSNKWNTYLTIIIFDFQTDITFFYFVGFSFLSDIFDFRVFPLIFLILYSIQRLHNFNCLSLIDELTFPLCRRVLCPFQKQCRCRIAVCQISKNLSGIPENSKVLEKYFWINSYLIKMQLVDM